MELYSIRAEDFKLDGGACYGVVPKSIWQKYSPADENNMVNIALRSLLIKDGDRLILIDTGIGNKQSEKYLSHFYIFGDNNLENSFAQTPYTFADVTDVILTHLHFDHCGGAVYLNRETGSYEPRFPNALYWVSKTQWELSINPNKREKASYLPENTQLLFERNLLRFVEQEQYFTENIFLKIVNGHTAGQIVPMINYKGNTLVYGGDFIPSIANISVPYIASFDTQPLLTMDEKEAFLEEAVTGNYILFFEHDYYHECCTIKKDERGRYREGWVLSLAEICPES